MDLSKKIFKYFKGRGLSLSGEASRALESVLAKEPDVEFAQEQIYLAIEKRQLSSTVIGVDVISSVIADLTSSEDDLKQESLQVFDAFETPKLVYEERQRSYKINPKPTTSLFGTVESRAQMYRERLQLTLQRLLRSGNFVMKGLSSSNRKRDAEQAVELSTVESLLGSPGRKAVFGMITQPDEGKYHLEDCTGSIPLDLSQASPSTTIISEGFQVIVEGELLDGVMRVRGMVLPPAESRQKSLTAMGILDSFGGESRRQVLEQLYSLEISSTDAMFVIISDILLERPQVVEKLGQVFKGFEDVGIDPLFILMGPFVTLNSMSSGGRDNALNAFETLADLIEACPRLCKQAKFLIIPGAEDPGFTKVLPKKAIPEVFREKLQSRVSHVKFGSNPCRIRYYTQEIVLYRENMLRKLQRFSVLPPQAEMSSEDVTEQLVQALLDQAHLWPLPLHAKPIYWELDHAMRLTPLPDMLVLGDQLEHYSYEFDDCKAVNPGSFTSDFSFIVYRPANRTVELSRVK